MRRRKLVALFRSWFFELFVVLSESIFIERKCKMAGGGNKRDEGPIKIQSTNLFAALDTRKKKKKTDKAGKSKGSSKSSQATQKEPEPQVFWAPTPLKVKSWADIDDDDEDDDYYATTAPLQSGWDTSEPSHVDAKDTHVEVRSPNYIRVGFCFTVDFSDKLLQTYQFMFGGCFGCERI